MFFWISGLALCFWISGLALCFWYPVPAPSSALLGLAGFDIVYTAGKHKVDVMVQVETW